MPEPLPATPDLLVPALPDLGCGTACPCTCPGQALGNADVVCGQDMGPTCQLTCRGENYDVDGDPKNGCELNHSVPPGHTQADAADRGKLTCFDTATDTFLEFLLSDSRTHVNPAIGGFSAQVGSAPDYWRVQATGGTLCVNDFDVTFATSGGGTDQCYQCTIITDKKSQHVLATGKDLVHLTAGSGSYSDNSSIYFKIEKICSLPRQEGIRYSIMYHL
jgi:hypothetical protein